MIWSPPTVPSPSCMVPQTGGGGNTGVILNNRCCCYYYNRHWGPQRKSSQRSGGWKTCQCSSIGCIFFLFFMSTLLFLLALLATAYRCWAQLFSWFEEHTCVPDWTEINVAKSKFSMLKSIEMRHPEHPSCKVQLHPAEEHDLEITLTLEENEEFVGFQFFEAKQGAQKTNIVKMNSSLFIEVFNKSARVGAMEKRDLPVRSRIRKPKPASGTIHTFWSARRRRRMWNHCRDTSSPPLRSLGDVVGSLPRPSLPLMAQSKETRHRLKLVRKDSVVFESRRLECLPKFIEQIIYVPYESRANQIEVRDCRDLPKFPRNHLVWTRMLYPSDEIDKSFNRSAGLP